MKPVHILDLKYFQKDVLETAPDLLGKYLVVKKPGSGRAQKFIITETEAYRGEEDLACHANKGRTKRTEVMYLGGGHIYVYLIYGMYWMLNIVTGQPEEPQAVLIRGVADFNGPGKLTKALGIDKSFNGKPLGKNTGLWIENSGIITAYKAFRRIGVDYSGDKWKNKLWRFTINENH